MNSILLRNIPNEIMTMFRKRAAEQKTSLNKAVVSLLQEAFGAQAPKKKIHHDLDDWFAKASWTPEAQKEAEEFNRQLLEDRRRGAEAAREKEKRLREYFD